MKIITAGKYNLSIKGRSSISVYPIQSIETSSEGLLVKFARNGRGCEHFFPHELPTSGGDYALIYTGDDK